MITISSKRNRAKSLPDPIVVLTYTLVIGALLFWGAYTSTFHTSPGRTNQAPNMVDVYTDPEASFAEDLQYWDANCSYGQDSDLACKMIMAKAQSCEISTASTYCSEYKTYMQQFLNR